MVPKSRAGIPAEPVQECQDQDCACAVDRKPRAVECAAVYELTVRYQMHAHFPQPSEERHAQEDGDQRPDGVVTHIVQGLNQHPAFFLRDRIEPYRISLELYIVDHGVDANVFSLVLFPGTVLLSAQDQDAEIIGQETTPAGQFLPFLFRRVHDLDHVRVFCSDQRRVSLLIEISVVQKF